MARCILYEDREECIGCGDCRCEFDPEKICDNCMACERGEGEFRSILIDGIRLEDTENGETDG
ncbi:MAG: hypothetical protein IKS31_05425 [Clostridia bacterium]|nr:hypothetical protein [Clostridia bacterium]